MDYAELIQESTQSLAVNKVRTFLAVLGVVIGIGSVIALISLGQSSQANIENQIEALGTNLLTIRPGFVTSREGVRGGFGEADSLTLKDAQALSTDPSMTAVAAVAPVVTNNSQLVAGRQNSRASIYGVTPDYLKVNNLQLNSGTFISANHLAGMMRVVVLGSTLVTDLFGDNTSPVGKSLRLNNQTFTVIGTLSSLGGSGPFSQDEIAYVPLTTAQSVLFGNQALSSINVMANSAAEMELAKNQINNLLLSRHQIKTPEQADFRIMSQEDLLATVSSVTGTFTALLSGIAAISLIVGGIGIMNIMLMSVTERTKEIGLRKALGAKEIDIITQFLLEAIVITLIGGSLGLIIGVATAKVITTSLNLPFSLAPYAIILAVSVSAGIGIIFGWYPAKKAASLQPIDALRYE